MTPITKLTTVAVLATLAAPTLAATAGATPNCTGRAALTTYAVTLTDTTYTATFTPTPGCEQQDITIAAHNTAHPTWDPTELQPLIASHTVQAGTGELTWTLPNGVSPRCRLQLDLITGPPLPEINPTSRYNETAIGGTRNRLVDARYSESLCTATGEPTPIPTQPVEPPTTTQVTPPETDVPLEEAPTTTTPEVLAPSTVPPASSSTLPEAAVVGGDPTPALPVTGSPTLILMWFGGALVSAGALIVGGTECRTRKDIR